MEGRVEGEQARWAQLQEAQRAPPAPPTRPAAQAAPLAKRLLRSLGLLLQQPFSPAPQGPCSGLWKGDPSPPQGTASSCTEPALSSTAADLEPDPPRCRPHAHLPQHDLLTAPQRPRPPALHTLWPPSRPSVTTPERRSRTPASSPPSASSPSSPELAPKLGAGGPSLPRRPVSPLCPPPTHALLPPC